MMPQESGGVTTVDRPQVSQSHEGSRLMKKEKKRSRTGCVNRFLL